MSEGSYETTTQCYCWKLISRLDGRTICATEHDRPLLWQDETYTPGLAVETSSLRQTSGLAPEPLDVSGGLNADGLTLEDLRSGVWDGAQIRIYRVDWSDTSTGHWLWSGYISDIEEQGGRFSVRLSSIKSDLERTIGRVYSRYCDADLGDTRCGVDLEAVPQKTCDKRYATCKNIFQNTENFRGFPHMPGNDVVISGPGEKRDGSSRGVEL